MGVVVHAIQSARDGDLLASYHAAAWTVETPGGPLEVRPGRPAPAPLRPSGIVTAFNPASRPLAADANRRADAALRARIAALGLSALPTLAHDARGGADGGGTWDEPGWCLTGDVRDDVIRLGADFGQNAIVWIDTAGEVTLVSTRDGFCGARIGEVLGPSRTESSRLPVTGE